MKDQKKCQEVQFYLDRTIDATVMIMKSIVDNPRIPVPDRIAALKQIADFHGSIALDLQKCLYGMDVSLSLKGREEVSP